MEPALLERLRAAVANHARARAGPCTVYALPVRVVDGDTAEFAFTAPPVYEGDPVGAIVVESVRFLGVNTPELRSRDADERAAAVRAKLFVEQRVGDVVQLAFERKRRDKYGRWLARPLVRELDGLAGERAGDLAGGGDWVSLPQLLIDAGLGVPYDV